VFASFAYTKQFSCRTIFALIFKGNFWGLAYGFAKHKLVIGQEPAFRLSVARINNEFNNAFMSQTKKTIDDIPKSKDEKPQEKPPWFRETVESFGVALILAFLFRAFVAEAFVIPTGSMAPALMGAHKDVRCPECGFDYQAGASVEFDELGYRTDNIVLTATCPLCRFELPLDLANNANHWTFSGDRILVSKFAYMFKKPKRWDVIVFKYPNDARINYIKRCTGLPNEKLQVYNGDIYTTKKGDARAVVERKPANIVNTMLQPIYDSNYLSKTLVKAGVPNAWQPFPKDNTSWQTKQSESEWQATCDATSSADVTWLRYYHRVFGPKTVRSNSLLGNQRPPVRLSWDMVEGPVDGQIDPYFSSPIFDFTSYNSSLVAHRSSIIDKNEKPNKLYRSGVNPREYAQFGFWQSDQRSPINFMNDGVNWVGDLACEFDVDVQSTTGTIVLDLVEAGRHHTCTIDVATGRAKLGITRKREVLDAFTEGEAKVPAIFAETSVRSGKARLKFANVDDQLLLWVNGRLQKFSSSSQFDVGDRPGVGQNPAWTAQDPLDAAPVGLGLKGVKATVSRSRVWRDVYYIASSNGDYSFNPVLAQESLLDRNQWEKTDVVCERRVGNYTLGPNEYFPMGDNSPASSDARYWGPLPEELLIGRAILVFWPHHWNRPIPYTPNIKRFRLIR
jgi:signal peptidase I